MSEASSINKKYFLSSKLSQSIGHSAAGIDPYIFLMSEAFIRGNWEAFRIDADNPRPEIETPEEWIAEAQAGKIHMLGAKVVVQNIPHFTLPA